MTLQNFVCWDRNNVSAVAAIDAASIEHLSAQDDAVFLATHHPLAVRRVPIGQPGAGSLESSRDVLEEFCRPLIGNDPHVVLITGSVGTGKSHLVKWINANAHAHADWHQVYIEKRNTNLRRVIETILQGLSGPTIDELREKLAIAQSAIANVEEAKSRVLSELAHFVEFPATELAALSPEEQYARTQLPSLLRDPVLADHLLSPDGAIDRITRLGMSGEAPDNEADLFISEGDLPLDVADVVDASKPAQAAIRFIAANAQLRSRSIEVLNDELSRAKAAVFVGGGVDLIGVFEEVRRELSALNLELALYIEDLVLLHGIDRELAQVFTQGRGPQGELCATRIAIAVTEGYLAAGFDTLKSRAVHFSLNLTLGDEVPAADARSFVGRYLNAIRVGPSELARVRSDGDVEDWLPNACQDCTHRVVCHEAFGTDQNGYGLYPLNAGSVDYLVALSSGEGQTRRFDPREVIRGVIRGPLEVASFELPEGTFPSKRFASELDPHRARVATEVKYQLGDGELAERRITLLNFWNSRKTSELVNLDPTVHHAFSLPVADEAETHQDSSPGDDAESPRPPVPSPEEDSEIEKWAQGQMQLPAATARMVRQKVLDAIVDEIRVGAHGITVSGTGKQRRFLLGGVPFDDSCIRIDAASGGGAEVERPLTIRITKSPRNAVVLKAIRREDRTRSWSAAGHTSYLEFRSAVDSWVSEVARKVSKIRVEPAPAILILAATSGPYSAEGRPSIGEQLESILRCVPTSDDRSRGWAKWYEEVSRARPLALEYLRANLGAAKSTGGTSMLDVAQLIGPLKQYGSSRIATDGLGGPSNLDEALGRLSRSQELAVRQEWDRIDTDLHTVLELAPPPDTWAVICSTVSDTVGEAHSQGLLPMATALDDLKQLEEDVEPMALELARRLATINRNTAASLWDLVPDPRTQISELASFLNYSNDVLDVLERKVEGDSSRVGQDVSVGDVATALRAYASGLDDLLTEDSK